MVEVAKIRKTQGARDRYILFAALLGAFVIFKHLPDFVNQETWWHGIGLGLNAVAVLICIWKAVAAESELRNLINAYNNEKTIVRSTEDRLDELERLKRRDMVTPEEYAAKRQEILKDL